jgi:CheY-like chemotaxis protein
VIDDTPEIAELICATAQRLDVECRFATRVDDFLAALTPEIHLILMDMKMPEMNGRELLTLLAAHHCRARIVLMSGVGGSVLAEATAYGTSLGLRMGGVLAKPFRMVELMDAING